MRTPQALQPFRHSIFRSVWLANLASNFGGLIQTVGAGWMMAVIAGTADMVTLVQAAATLPIMLFSLLSGAIADNFNRRTVMLLAQLFMFAVSALLAVATYGGLMTPWLLLAFTFLIGCGLALNNPSWQASLAEMVPKSDLPAAIALNGLGFNITRGVGPAVGGAIVAGFGAAMAFMVNALSYIPLFFVLWRWKAPERATALPREALLPAMTAGLRYVAMSPNIQAILLRSFVFGFSVISVLALLPIVARDMLDGDALLYGMLFAAFGIGAVCGALVSGHLRARYSTEWAARLAFLGFAACALMLALVPWAWLMFLALVVGGACWVIALSMFNISVQLSTPRWVVGRALSLYQTAVFGGQALGAWTWGVTAEALGPEYALAIAAASMLAGAAIGVGRLALPALSSADLDPSNRWTEPKPAWALTPRSGPVIIKIDYVVSAGNVPAFLELMVERRRIKRRDGARHWMLVHDIENATVWTESYAFPTWLDYVRYSKRMTQADTGLTDQIRRLHTGDEPPRIRRVLQETLRRPDAHTANLGVTDLP
ncbi:MFS transporter [Pelagibacterium mangrovi]|uniref:MFS transporter n=1 Tax=Pelagibacterium mangrovi TaxID=3119828 RepID=UPI002FCB07DF